MTGDQQPFIDIYANGDSPEQRYDFGFDGNLEILAIRELDGDGGMGILAEAPTGDIGVFMFNDGEAPTFAHIGNVPTDWQLL